MLYNIIILEPSTFVIYNCVTITVTAFYVTYDWCVTLSHTLCDSDVMLSPNPK